MPAGDKTGPMGDGPVTGRGAGYCGGNDSPGFASSGRVDNGFRGPGRGKGLGRGGGGRRGRRNQYYESGLYGWQRAAMRAVNAPDPVASGTRNRELGLLRRQLDRLESAVAAIRSRLNGSSRQEI